RQLISIIVAGRDITRADEHLGCARRLDQDGEAVRSRTAILVKDHGVNGVRPQGSIDVGGQEGNGLAIHGSSTAQSIAPVDRVGKWLIRTPAWIAEADIDVDGSPRLRPFP